MKKISLFRRLLLATMLCAPMVASAQVAIGTNQTPTATLQVVGTPSDATPAGVIAPRVTVAALNTSAANYGTNQTGAIVYVTDATGASIGGKTAAITAAGYYYFDGTADVWKALGGAPAAPFILSFGNTGSFTVTNQDYVELVVTSPGYTLTLPDASSPNPPAVGRLLYISNANSTQDVNVTPRPRHSGLPYLPAGHTAIMLYLGGTGDGSWDFVTGY
jgi:hypothetical protein